MFLRFLEVEKEYESFFRELHLKATDGTKTIYDGNFVDSETYLDLDLLGSLEPGMSKVLDLELTVPFDLSQELYQNYNGQIEWEFQVESFMISDGILPKPNKPGLDIVLPGTGVESNYFGYYIMVLGISLISIDKIKEKRANKN